MHRLVPIYLSTHLFYCFYLKELSNVNLQIKRDNELQKRIAHTSIWRRKKESNQKCMMPKKVKGLLINWNVKKFKHQSHNEILWFKNIKCYDEFGVKWKASKLCNQVMWEVIYAFFYNWYGSHYLVLIVYAWVKLIIEASH